MNFLLDNKLMIVQKNFEDLEDFQDFEGVEDLESIPQIRRLSTKSYVTNPENPVATAWTWYWKDEDGIWLQYDVDQLVRLKQVLYPVLPVGSVRYMSLECHALCLDLAYPFNSYEATRLVANRHFSTIVSNLLSPQKYIK